MVKYGISTCKACGATIRWMITAKLKRMPCDPEAIKFNPAAGPETFISKGGNVVRGRRDKNGTEVGYISHFATCPNADSFRKKGE